MTADQDSKFTGPEPFTIGDPGRSYVEIRGGAPFVEDMPNDTVCDGFDFGSWSIRAASVRGLLHRYSGTPRQDAYSVRYVSDEQRIVAAVCDGVGGSPQSHHAARIGSTYLADALRRGPLPVGPAEWSKVFTDAAQAISTFASAHFGVDSADSDAVRSVLASTAAVVVISQTDSAERWPLVCASIGDSEVWAVPAGSSENRGGWRSLAGGKDRSGDVAVTATSALPSRKEVAVAVSNHHLESVEILLACTDGIGDALVEGTGTVANSLGAEWDSPPTPINFAAQVSFGRRTFVDDRTGVAIWAPGARNR